MQAIVERYRVTERPEELIEHAARKCYKSESKEGVDPGGFIRSLIKRGHTSILEHAVATYDISNVSRAMTHQLVRHRLASYSQESQRYVDACNFKFITPPSMNDDIKKQFTEDMWYFQFLYQKYRAMGCLKEDARFILPNATATTILMTANFAEWRHILNLRCDKAAQWEIREVCTFILNDLYSIAPNVFYDLYEKYIAEK